MIIDKFSSCKDENLFVLNICFTINTLFCRFEIKQNKSTKCKKEF